MINRLMCPLPQVGLLKISLTMASTSKATFGASTNFFFPTWKKKQTYKYASVKKKKSQFGFNQLQGRKIYFSFCHSIVVYTAVFIARAIN